LTAAPALVSTKLVITNMGVIQKLPAQERKAAIVEVAIRIFSEKGFRGTTTKELAAAVGVSEPVIYQHFSTKSELYAAIIDSKSQAVGKVVEDLATYLESDDDRGFFRHLAQMVLDFHDSDPAYLRLLLFSALERHELSDLFHERHATCFVEGVVRYIERRIEQGAMRPLNATLIAHSFLGMVAQHGMDRMLASHQKCPLPRDEVIDGMVDIFMRGIQNEAY
jgi:AcrR family transcriptional regulator